MGKTDPDLIDPKSEPTRADMKGREYTFAEFLERTRRVQRVTSRKSSQRYARGLDSKPEDFA